MTEITWRSIACLVKLAVASLEKRKIDRIILRRMLFYFLTFLSASVTDRVVVVRKRFNVGPPGWRVNKQWKISVIPDNFDQWLKNCHTAYAIMNQFIHQLLGVFYHKSNVHSTMGRLSNSFGVGEFVLEDWGHWKRSFFYFADLGLDTLRAQKDIEEYRRDINQ